MNENEIIEEIEKKRKQLLYRSWHRGMREMDLIMGRFADKHIHEFDEVQLLEYEAVLGIGDPDLYSFITGKKEVPSNLLNSVMKKLIADQELFN
jgi:antitoxin CptB